MQTNKLHLKRTPAEQAAHDIKKARRSARKANRRRKHDHSRSRSPSGSQKHEPSESKSSGDPHHDSDDEYGPHPASHSHSHKPDYDEVFAQLEEERFREKMWGAFEDDERLDSVEARMGSYAHVPRRWRSGGMDRLDDETLDPHMMEDDDYAEWVRMGIWRKQHAAEHEEQVRQEAERTARRQREKALRAETERLEKEAEADRRRRRSERHRVRQQEARQLYEARWKDLLSGMDAHEGPRKELTFEDIPWPIDPTEAEPSASDTKGKRRTVEIALDAFTAESISSFLLQEVIASDDQPQVSSKTRKDRLRETMLRFHPDKFEGRILGMVRSRDRQRVQEAAGKVVRVLNEMMSGR